MKWLAYLIVTTFLSISYSESKYILAPVVSMCHLLLPVENYSQTIFFDMDVHAHPELKTCILKKSVADQSILLLNVYGSDLNIKLNVTRKFLGTTDNPNVMIMTRYLTTKIVDSTLLRFFIQSNWSLLYIIVTGERKFKCENGTMNPKDFSFLDNIMNTLWHRFQIMRVGVVFPFACRHKMVIYDGKRPSARNLYDRTIKLVEATQIKYITAAIKKSGEKLSNDYPIQASIFSRYPTSITECKNIHYYMKYNFNLTNGFCGLDGMVMHDILSHSKFKLSFTKNKECNDYGYVTPEKVTGALGCIIRSELDISFNSRFMTLYSNEHIYYLHYIITDTLCAAVRRPEVIPLWHGVFNVFTPVLWAIIYAVLLAIGIIMWATAMINKRMTGTKTMTFWKYLLDSVMTTMLGSSHMKIRTMVVLKSTCLLGSVFFLALYQGHLSRVYTTVKRFDQIKTLRELYTSGFTLYISPAVRELMKQIQDPEDKLQAKFFERAQLIPGERLGIVLQHANAATIGRRLDAKMEITKSFSDSDETPLIDLVDECFHTYYLSYIARSGFPFYEELQLLTERLSEAGLPTMYYKRTRLMLDIADSRVQHDIEPRAFFQIRLKDQRAAFAILFVGTVLSILVFATEMWKARNHVYL